MNSRNTTATMEVIQAFNLNDQAHDIHIHIDINESTWFRAYDIGKVLGIKDVTSSIRHYDEVYKSSKPIKTIGGEQQVLFLSELGLYKLIMSSRKPAAEHFQKWVFTVIQTLRKTGKYVLVEENATNARIIASLTNENVKLQKQLRNAQHDIYLEHFNKSDVVYFGIVGSIDGKMLLKIGSTKDVKERDDKHRKDYGEFCLIHVFAHTMFIACEKALHSNDFLRKLKYRKPLKLDGTTSTEVYLITESDLASIKRIASFIASKADVVSSAELELGIAKVVGEINTSIIENNTTWQKQLEHNVKVMENYVSPAEEHLQAAIEILSRKRNYTQARGDKVQAYHEDGRLHATYISINSAKKAVTGSNSQLKIAVKDNNVYKKFRWMFLPRHMPDDTVQNLPPTRDVSRKTQKHDMIAVLNRHETEVVKVFKNQKAVCDYFDVGPACISSATDKPRKAQGHTIKTWSNVPERLKKIYLETHTLPEPHIRKNAKPVNQYDLLNNFIKTFPSVSAVLDELGMGRGNLFQAINAGFPIDKFYYKYAA